MDRHQTGRIAYTAYLILYLCLLIPGHLAAFAADYSLTAGLDETDTACHHHDSTTCHICLTGGQMVGPGVYYIADIDTRLITLTVPGVHTHPVDSYDSRKSTRAPPAFN